RADVLGALGAAAADRRSTLMHWRTRPHARFLDLETCPIPSLSVGHGRPPVGMFGYTYRSRPEARKLPPCAMTGQRAGACEAHEDCVNRDEAWNWGEIRAT